MKLFEISDLDSDLRKVLLELSIVSPWPFKKGQFAESKAEFYSADDPNSQEYLLVKTEHSRFRGGTVVVRLCFSPMSEWPFLVEKLLINSKKWEVVYKNLTDRHTTKKYLLDDYHLKVK